MTPRQRRQAAALGQTWAQQYLDSDADRQFLGMDTFITMTTMLKDCIGLDADLFARATRIALKAIEGAEVTPVIPERVLIVKRDKRGVVTLMATEDGRRVEQPANARVWYADIDRAVRWLIEAQNEDGSDG